MNNIAAMTCASVVVFGSLIYPQVARAEGFTGKEFSSWSEASQNSYIQTSMMMAGVVATRYKPEISSCVDDWYFADAATIEERNKAIRGAIAENSAYHPSGVILAVIQGQCGSFESD